MSNAIVIVSILVVPPLIAFAIRKLWIAAAVSAFTLSAILHVAGWLGAGYIDPYYPISVPISLVVFLLWSLGVAWLLQRARAVQTEERSKLNKTMKSESDGASSGRNR